MSYWILFLLLASIQTFPRAQEVLLDVGVRSQWEENFGYCGEVSFVTAGLYYGQYVSQYDARKLASPGMSESDVESQLLLGVNDESAAERMRLAHEEWEPADDQDPRDFLAWVKRHLLAGHPVAIALYMNMSAFHENRQGDADYDHIVPVLGFLSNFSDGAYHDSDILLFSDNGLYTGAGQPYRFAVPFSALVNDRMAANMESSPIYSVPAGTQYGIALTGALGGAVPVRIATDKNFESPDIEQGSDVRPRPSELTLTVSASNLDPRQTYILYRYDSFASVPDADFNANSARAAEQWVVKPGRTYLDLDVYTDSSETSVFRLVPASAP